jgi:hypothetical protein
MEAWRRYYNDDRPHGAIGHKLPISKEWTRSISTRDPLDERRGHVKHLPLNARSYPTQGHQNKKVQLKEVHPDSGRSSLSL